MRTIKLLHGLTTMEQISGRLVQNEAINSHAIFSCHGSEGYENGGGGLSINHMIHSHTPATSLPVPQFCRKAEPKFHFFQVVKLGEKVKGAI